MFCQVPPGLSIKQVLALMSHFFWNKSIILSMIIRWVWFVFPTVVIMSALSMQLFTETSTVYGKELKSILGNSKTDRLCPFSLNVAEISCRTDKLYRAADRAGNPHILHP